jgi:hypothetical protein
MLRARLNDAVPVRGRPAPMTWKVVSGFGLDGWAPMVGPRCKIIVFFTVGLGYCSVFECEVVLTPPR